VAIARGEVTHPIRGLGPRPVLGAQVQRSLHLLAVPGEIGHRLKPASEPAQKLNTSTSGRIFGPYRDTMCATRAAPIAAPPAAAAPKVTSDAAIVIVALIAISVAMSLANWSRKPAILSRISTSASRCSVVDADSTPNPVTTSAAAARSARRSSST
jgi:hypothetical protein